METEQNLIHREYVNKLESYFVWPFKISGLMRFETKDSKLVDKSLRSILRGTIILLIWNWCGLYILYDTTVLRSNYLLLSEFFVLLQFFFIQNSICLNVMFPNRKSGLMIMKTCINLDVLFGINDTKFMRTIASQMYAVQVISLFIVLIVFTFAIVFSHAVFFSIVITESTFVILSYMMLHDYVLVLPVFTFLSMRIRYLNISLIKMANLKRNYFPKHLIFDTLFWKDKYDNFVNFHKQANLKEYKEAVTSIYELFRHIESSFRFCIFIALVICISGLFITVQWIVSYIKATDVSSNRTGAVTLWVVFGWLYLYILGDQADIVHRHIEDTKLICSYIFLKPNLPGKFIELAESILHILAAQKYKISIYGMFDFNTDLMINIVEAVIVYIIMQLQLSLAPTSMNSIKNNVTVSQSKTIFLM